MSKIGVSCVRRDSAFFNIFSDSNPAFPTLPRHKGYEQLAIILEKERDYDNALLICLEAKEAGWNTDWDKRILTVEKKMKKNGKS